MELPTIYVWPIFQDPEIPIDIISKKVQEGYFSVYFEAPGDQ